MRQPSHEEHIGGTAAHVGDCFLWAEIYYLDSRTDYREYLPIHHLQAVRINSPLVMLEKVNPAVRPAARILFAVLCSVALVFLSVVLGVGHL